MAYLTGRIATGRRLIGSGDLPPAEHQRSDFLFMEEQVRWDERIGGSKAAGFGSRECQTQAIGGGLDFGQIGFAGRDLKKSLTPVEQREFVLQLQVERGLSQRRAIRLIGCNRKTARYLSKRGQDVELRERLNTLAHQNPAWGYKLLWGTLRGEGFMVNLKKLYRLYKEEQLQLRRKGKKRLKSEGRGLPQAATQPNQEWCLDFVHDALSDGRSFRSLTMLDAFTRQCLHIECDTSLSGERVVRVLEQLRQVRGVPQRLRIDNGPEFRSKNLDIWAKEHGVDLFFIEPGKPTQNGQIESFNGRFRAECLDQEWFHSLSGAKHIIEAWRKNYNSLRPHSRLGYLPPNTWAQKQKLSPQFLHA